MTENINKELTGLKGFTFDGNTGRTLSDLYEAVNKIGYTTDTPFVMPSWREGDERPVVVNSYLDPEGKRVHIVWHSDDSGLSHVTDIILDAPSLAKEKEASSCEMCGGGCNIPGEFENNI